MSETEQKKHEASNRKLSKQRKEGSVPQTSDASSMYGTAVGIVAISATSLTFWDALASSIIASSDLFALPFDEARKVGMKQIGYLLAAAILPVLLAVLFVSVGLTLIMNKGPVFSMKPVIPDLKRLSFTTGFQRIFGKRGRVEIIAALLRLLMWVGFCVVVALIWLPMVFKSVECDALCLALNMWPALKWIVAAAIVFFLIFASVSIIQQRKIFMHEQRMTDTERKQERKDQNGSPEVSKERNRLRQKLNMSGNAKVPIEATTIVVTAPDGMVGIVYDPPEYNLPLVTVKKRDAAQAQDMAEHLSRIGVPVIEDQELYLGCRRTTKGEMIPAKMFQTFARAVAKANL